MPELCRQQGLGGRQAGVRVSGVDGRSGGGEVRWAQSAEMDTQAHVWSIPATRMKANREHRVPLRRRAVELLDAARARGDGGRPLVFTVGDGALPTWAQAAPTGGTRPPATLALARL